VPPNIVLPVAVVVGVILLTPIVVNAFLKDVEAGEIRLVSWLNGKLKIFRGPCKAVVVPVFTVSRVIPAQAINVDIEITDQTADLDPNGLPAPVKVTVKASAIVSVGEDDAMVNTAANKFFSKPPKEQLSTLIDVLSSAGRRATNLLRHDQLFNSKSASTVKSLARAASDAGETAGPGTSVATTPDMALAEDRGEDDELAVIIKEACSRELLDLGLSFNSLNIKAVLSEVADARRRESAARAEASADVVQAQEQQRARIAQLEAEEKINDQERALKTQIAANGAAIARAEAERQAAIREQRQAELNASQITQAQADADQNVIALEAQGRAEAARIRLVAEAEAEAIREKAQALSDAGQMYLELRKLELAPELAQEVAKALGTGQFINFGSGASSAASSGSNDVMRVVETLMAAQVITGQGVRPAGGPSGNDQKAVPARRFTRSPAKPPAGGPNQPG
jgi:flotillin